MTAISHRLGLASLVFVVMFGGCSTSGSSRDVCYAKATEKAAAAGNKLCPVGDAGPDAAAWDLCPHRDAINAEFLSDMRSCK